jgi:hypothetical protein
MHLTNVTRFREEVITRNPNRHAPPDFWNAIGPLQPPPTTYNSKFVGSRDVVLKDCNTGVMTPVGHTYCVFVLSSIHSM